MAEVSTRAAYYFAQMGSLRRQAEREGISLPDCATLRRERDALAEALKEARAVIVADRWQGRCAGGPDEPTNDPLLTQIDAALASIKEWEMSAWKPIASAPQGYDKDRGFHRVLFKGHSKGNRSFSHAAYVDGWIDSSGTPVHAYSYKLEITHWMEIPT